MRKKILVAALALGTIAGYGFGFASMRCSRGARRAAFEQHVAKLCVDAAGKANAAAAVESRRP